jgi:indole-3-glycerol phosphate synthase
MSAASASILQRIAGSRRERVEAMKLAVPPHELRKQLPATRPGGRLERALRRKSAQDALRLLCEIKRASPSRGVLRAEIDAPAIAAMYEAGGAAAISVVTEPDHFQGEIGWIDAIRPRVSLPLLLKDFVIDPYQILDAAVRGADAVLLIASLISEVQLQILIGEARQLGLDSLVEVHDAIELRSAVRAGATIVGINNRDLHTFDVRLETSLELLPQVPALVTAVSESGLSTPADLARLRETRCDAALMGEVFMTSPDAAGTLRALIAAARG